MARSEYDLKDLCRKVGMCITEMADGKSWVADSELDVPSIGWLGYTSLRVRTKLDRLFKDG